MTEDNAEDLPPELVMPVFRAVQDYIAGMAEKEVEAAGHKLSNVMDLGTAEVTAALQKLQEKGWVNVGRHVIVGPRVTVEALTVLGADTITFSEGARVLPLDIGVLATKASQSGIAGP